MQRVFASLCLTASLVFFAAGCGGEDPEVAKHDVLIIEIIKMQNDAMAMAEAAKKDPTKIDAGKLMENSTKMMDKMAAFQKLPKTVQDKLIAKHKAEWEKVEKAAKGK